MRALLIAVILTGCAGVVESGADAGSYGDASAHADGADGGCWIDSGGHFMACDDGTRCYYQPGVATCPGQWSCASSDGLESCRPR